MKNKNKNVSIGRKTKPYFKDSSKALGVLHQIHKLDENFFPVVLRPDWPDT